MGDRRTGAAAAAASVVVATLVVLALAQLVLPSGPAPLAPGRAEASCVPALVYDDVLWFTEKPAAPVVLGDAVGGVLYPPCNDAGQSERETQADAYRVVGLSDDYLATGTGEGQLFRRSDQAYVPAPLGARGAVDTLAVVGLLVAVGLGLLVAVRTLVRRRRESQLPPLTGP